MSRIPIRRLAPLRNLAWDGTAMRTARKATGLTQEELAREIHMTLRTIQRWEDGSSQPKASALLALCDVLEVAPEAFFQDGPVAA